MENEIITVEELCSWLKVSRRTTERWRSEGLPFIKLGRSIRFEKAEVLKWLENHKETSKN